MNTCLSFTYIPQLLTTHHTGLILIWCPLWTNLCTRDQGVGEVGYKEEQDRY